MYDSSINRNSDTAEKPERPAPLNMSNQHHTYNNSPQNPQYNQPSASPAPIHHPHQVTHQPSNTYNQPLDAYPTPPGRYAPPQPGAYPRQSEVYRLPENANQLIPQDIRDQFQQDEHGHILFFTSPPVDTLPPIKPGSAIGHTARYLAAKHRDKLAANEKRKVEDLSEEVKSSPAPNEAAVDSALVDTATPQQPPAKKPKHAHPSPNNEGAATAADNDDDSEDLPHQILSARTQALQLWIDQLQNSTDRIYQDLYGEHWEAGKEIEAEKLAKLQAEERRKRGELEESLRERERRVEVDLRGRGWFRDDRDPRY